MAFMSNMKCPPTTALEILVQTEPRAHPSTQLWVSSALLDIPCTQGSNPASGGDGASLGWGLSCRAGLLPLHPLGPAPAPQQELPALPALSATSRTGAVPSPLTSFTLLTPWLRNNRDFTKQHCRLTLCTLVDLSHFHPRGVTSRGGGLME